MLGNVTRRACRGGAQNRSLLLLLAATALLCLLALHLLSSTGLSLSSLLQMGASSGPRRRRPSQWLSEERVDAVWSVPSCVNASRLGSVPRPRAASPERDHVLDVLCGSRVPDMTEMRLAGADDVRAVREFAADDAWFDEAFVCFFQGARFAASVERVVRAVHMFSSRPIVVWALGDTFDMQPRSSVPRLVVVRAPREFADPWFAKLRAAALTPVRYGQIVEADSLVWVGADLLFRRLREETVADGYALPILPRHPDLRLRDRNDSRSTNPFLVVPDANRTMPYMHAHLTWAYNSLDFLTRLYLRGVYGEFRSDEAALNVALWERRAHKQWCIYDPSPDRLDAFLRRDGDSTLMRQPGNVQLAYYLIHGSKKPEQLDADLAVMLREARAKPLYYCDGQWSDEPSPTCMRAGMDEFVPCLL